MDVLTGKEDEEIPIGLKICFGRYLEEALTDLGVSEGDRKKFLCKTLLVIEDYEANKSKTSTEAIAKDLLSCIKDSTAFAIEEILVIILGTIFLSVLIGVIGCILYCLLKDDRNKGSLAGFVIFGVILLLIIIVVGAIFGIRNKSVGSKKRDSQCLEEFEKMFAKIEAENEDALTKAFCSYDSFTEECCKDGSCASTVKKDSLYNNSSLI